MTTKYSERQQQQSASAFDIAESHTEWDKECTSKLNNSDGERGRGVLQQTLRILPLALYLSVSIVVYVFL